MKKLRLEIEEICVETFEVAEELLERGTVHARQPTLGDTCTCDCSADGLCLTDSPCSGFGFSCAFTWCAGTQCVIYC